MGFFVSIMEKRQTTKKTGGGGQNPCVVGVFFQLKFVCLLMFKVLSSVSSSPKVPSSSPTLSDLAHHITIHRVTQIKGHNPSLTSRFLVSLVILSLCASKFGIYPSRFDINASGMAPLPLTVFVHVRVPEFRLKPSFLTVTGRGATPKAFILRLDIKYPPHSAKKKTYWCHLHPTFIGSFWKEHHPRFSFNCLPLMDKVKKMQTWNEKVYPFWTNYDLAAG